MALTNVYNGSNGVLTLASENTPEGQDAKAVVDLYQIQTVGRVTGIQVFVQTDLEEFYEVGRRHPVSLHSGNIHVSGRVDRAHINGALLFLLLGRGAAPSTVAEPYVQPAFSMTIVLNDPAVPGNSVGLELKGVKFQNWAYTLPEDDFVLENATFKALSVRVVDSEAPAGGGQAVASAPSFPAAGGATA